MVVVSGTVLNWDSWLDGGLAWFVSPLTFESVSLWWLWSSLLSASGGEISGAHWLAVGGDPLIAGWKLSVFLGLDESNLLKLNIIGDWPWAIISTNLSTVSCLTCLSVSVHTSAFWKLWGTSGELFIVWSSIFLSILLGKVSSGLYEPVANGGVSTNLSAINFSMSI